MNIVLRTPDEARPLMATLWAKLIERLKLGQVMAVELKRETRSEAQNRRLHAMLTMISKRCEWAGAKRDVTTWKRLMTAAWLRACGESPMVLPSVDGAGIEVIYEKTSRMSVDQVTSLMDYIESWLAEHHPDLVEPLPEPPAYMRREVIDAETGEIVPA